MKNKSLWKSLVNVVGTPTGRSQWTFGWSAKAVAQSAEGGHRRDQGNDHSIVAGYGLLVQRPTTLW